MVSIAHTGIAGFARRHKVFSYICALVILVVAYMAFTGTLSYPYIMADRQIQSIRDCTFGSDHFTTDAYGFSFTVPEGYCVLPNRLFPRDGSIEVVLDGWYFVFDEYAKGTVARGSLATLLFEPVTDERNTQAIISNLTNGKFIDGDDVSDKTTASGVKYVLIENALGTDDMPYDWAFVTRPDGKYFVGIVTKHSADHKVFDRLLESLKPI